MDERPSPSMAAAAWVAAAMAVLVAILSPGPLVALIGPLALVALPVPVVLAAGAASARWAGAPTFAAGLGVAARLAVWVVGWRLVSDPAPTVVDAVASGASHVIGQISAGIRTAVAAVLGLLVVGGVIALMLGSPGASAAKGSPVPTEVRTGSELGPLAAMLLRSMARLAVAGGVLALWAILAASAWTATGVRGLRVALGGLEPATPIDNIFANLAGLLGRASAGIRYRLARRSAGWGRRETHGVWVAPVAIERGPGGELLGATSWRHEDAETPDVQELRELTSALVAAYDVALMTGAARAKGPDGGAEPRQAPPRPYPYRIEAVRAWTRPGFHGVVIRATPASANAVVAKVTAEHLLPTLDAETSWTAADLRGLHLSDRRVAQDPLRGGEPGVFVALDRHDASLDEAIAPAREPGQAAIERALREAGLGDRFRRASSDIGFDADTYEYRASFASSAEWRDLEAAWKALTPAIALFARAPAVRLETRLDPYGFIVVIPKATPEFPAGEATDWTRVVDRHEGTLRRRPLSFIIGLDHQGAPLIAQLGTETPHILVAGATGSGKSRSGLFSPLAQLIRLNEPSRLRLWLLDSVKREVTSLFGDAPHVERCVIVEDGDQVVTLLEGFTAAMDARYREQQGREFDPSRSEAKLLVIEEWSDLRDLLSRDQLERVLRAVNRVGQIGRAAGFFVCLITQKASAEVIPPRLKSNFKGRISGYFSQASDFGIMFDQHRRLLPNIPGRLAVSFSGGHEVRIVQGLYIDNATIRRVVQGLGPSLPDSAATLAPTVPIEPIEPRSPTTREIEQLDLLTLARLLYRWQATTDETAVVSVRSTVEHVRSLGFTAGRVERYTAGLAELEGLGILERLGDSPQSPRRIALGWPEAEVRLRRARPSE